MKKGLFLILLLCVHLVSCDKDDEQKLSISESELQFESLGGQKSVSIISNSNWHVSGAPEWCIINVSDGYGDGTLTITISPNEDTNVREAKLMISSETILKELTIQQNIKEATKLELSTTILRFINQSCERQFDIETDGVWSISDLPDWGSVDKDKGIGNATVTVYASSNETNQERKAEFTVSAGTISEKEMVKQVPLIATINGNTLHVVKPGSLIDFLPYADELQDVTELTITGKMNVMDVAQLNAYNSLVQLTSINMKDVQMERSHELVDNPSSEDDYFYKDDEFSGIAGFTRLESIILPEGITKISAMAFQNCRSLTTLTIPKGVTMVDVMAFESCKNLETIYFSNKLNYLGEAVFFSCDKLTEVHISNPVPPELNADALAYFNISSCTLYVPKGNKVAYEIDGWNQFKAIVEE